MEAVATSVGARPAGVARQPSLRAPLARPRRPRRMSPGRGAAGQPPPCLGGRRRRRRAAVWRSGVVTGPGLNEKTSRDETKTGMCCEPAPGCDREPGMWQRTRGRARARATEATCAAASLCARTVAPAGLATTRYRWWRRRKARLRPAASSRSRHVEGLQGRRRLRWNRCTCPSTPVTTAAAAFRFSCAPAFVLPRRWCIHAWRAKDKGRRNRKRRGHDRLCRATVRV